MLGSLPLYDKLNRLGKFGYPNNERWLLHCGNQCESFIALFFDASANIGLRKLAECPLYSSWCVIYYKRLVFNNFETKVNLCFAIAQTNMN